MYDYMKALQKRFDRQEHSKLDTQIERAQDCLLYTSRLLRLPFTNASRYCIINQKRQFKIRAISFRYRIFSCFCSKSAL